MKTKYLLILLCITLLLSCKGKVDSTYYESGELFIEKYRLQNEKGDFLIKEYFKNGQIRQKGILKNDSVPNGKWTIFYADGKLRWDGYIIDGVIQHDKFSHNWMWPNCSNFLENIEIEGNPEKLNVGKTYNFRVIMPDIHPKLYIMVDDSYEPIRLREKNNEVFPYTFTPVNIGSYFIQFVFMNSEGEFLVGNPSFYVELKIEE